MNRIDAHAVSPEAVAAMMGLELALARSSLEPRLTMLVRLRTSQLNGCAWCVDMEYCEALRAGEEHARLDQLAAWQGSALFSPRERAALAWTEFLARPAVRAADGAFAAAASAFAPDALADLSLLICAVQAWNRLGIAFRRPLYQ